MPAISGVLYFLGLESVEAGTDSNLGIRRTGGCGAAASNIFFNNNTLWETSCLFLFFYLEVEDA